MKPAPGIFAAMAGVAFAASACSGSVQTGSTALATVQPAAAGYVLNEEEKALNCKKLIGRMQVRILQIRDYEAKNSPSAVSQSLQSAAVMVGSGATYGLNTSADHARDRAQLAAYNQRLGELNCKTFNLDDELRPKAVTATPTPVAKTTADGTQTTVTVPISQIGQAVAKAKP